MKKKKWIGAMFFLMSVMLTFSVNTVFAGENLLRNPGFSEGIGASSPAGYSDARYWEAIPYRTTNSMGRYYHNYNWKYCFNLYVYHSVCPSGGGCFQVITNPANPDDLYPLVPGDVFSFSTLSYCKTSLSQPSNYTGKALVKIEFYDYDRREGNLGEPLVSFQSSASGRQAVKGTDKRN